MAELNRGTSQHARATDTRPDSTQAVRLQASIIDVFDVGILLG